MHNDRALTDFPLSAADESDNLKLPDIQIDEADASPDLNAHGQIETVEFHGLKYVPSL